MQKGMQINNSARVHFSVLATLANRLKDSKVVCVGDIMLDQFCRGDVERVSPEAPIPVLKMGKEAMMLGGAGNVINNIVALGGHVDAIGVIGDDAAGTEISNLIKSLDTVQSSLVCVPGHATSHKTRFIAGTQQILRVDREACGPFSEEVQRQLLDFAFAQINKLPPGASVVLSDYGKGVISRDFAHAVIRLARERDLMSIVDPKGNDYSLYARAGLITPNYQELSVAAGRKFVDEQDMIDGARDLIERHQLGAILVTRSQNGMTLVTAEKEVFHLPTRGHEVFDVSGAGDTVVATIAVGMSVGASLKEACSLANVAAGITVAKANTAVAHVDEILSLLYHGYGGGYSEKVMDRKQGQDLCDSWRQQRLKIGFTNGCFDLLHPGHISLLRQARQHSDRLMVAINDDQSVKRLKGKDRPIQNERERAMILASLDMVDGVVIFSEDTPFELLKALKPDVLVKGADYQIETVVGGDFVQSYGGEVVLAELEQGYSTTSAISRIRKL